MALPTAFSPNIQKWIDGGWKYELVLTESGVYTARLYSGSTTAHTKAAGTPMDAGVYLANIVPLTVDPLPP